MSISLLALSFMCVIYGYMGSLPWIAAIAGFPWTAYGVSQAFYYNKSKAENTAGGVVFETALVKPDPIVVEPTYPANDNQTNIDYGI